jgi:predicted DsbA family dithiol-disulfide isomerase
MSFPAESAPPAAIPHELTVDVWSDIACPFCWIGEHRLSAALTRLAAEWPEIAVARRWRPFQLQPDLPRPGVGWAEFARAKFGGEGGMAQAFGHVTRMGAEDGLEYRFDRVAAAPNTADAHRLVLHAEAEDAGGVLGARVAEALFRAYFHEGRHVGERRVLAEVAAEQGMDAAGVARVLDGDAYAAEVAASQQEAARLGIRGVPFVVLGGRYAVSGAQPVELFARAVAAAVDAPGADAGL